MACECSETSALRKRSFPIPAQHSCAYVETRNKMVRRAAAAASDYVQSLTEDDAREMAERAQFVTLMRSYVDEGWKKKLF